MKGLLVVANRGKLLEQDFAAQVIITARFTFDDFPVFQNNLQDISRGKIQAEIIATNPETILPLTDTPAEVD